MMAFAATLPAANAPNLNGAYTATAYSQQGKTASGDYVHRHIVAADPDILPIGSRIKVRRAGRYSGEYVVADTGEKIQGRRLDIYIPNTPFAGNSAGRRFVWRCSQWVMELTTPLSRQTWWLNRMSSRTLLRT